jgi:3-deoxy-manno-octulosonate cytidylyltransferase (CMP-KDO synthetase)
VVRFFVPPVDSTGPSSSKGFVSAVAIIPARYHSTRLPGKALADIGGRPMIEHVYRRALSAASVSRVIVATDDRRIADAVDRFGGEARMTSPSHESGTDRLAEVAATLDCDLIVNVQGDEPLLASETIDAAVNAFAEAPKDGSGIIEARAHRTFTEATVGGSTYAEGTPGGTPVLEMSTLRRRITDAAELHNPNVTKVVVDADGFAMYFSRAPIPFTRPGQPPAVAWAHIGMYVYRRATLLRLASLPPTAMERAEALEQLRALEHGIRIKAVKTAYQTIGVDTPEDLERVRALVAQTVTT